MNLRGYGLLVGAVLALGSARGESRAPTVRDLARIVRVGDPHLSPDGKTLVYVETRANLENDEFETEILLLPASGGESRPLTRGRHHAVAPRWSPSGDRIAFLAPDADKVMQIYVMPMLGGDAQQLTRGKDGIGQFTWSPDGESIAYAIDDPKPELKGEAKFRSAFKVGNDDITTSEAVRPTHLWLIGAQGGESKRLTSGTWSLPSSLPPGPPSSPLGWTPDGKSLVLVRQETPSTGDGFLTRIEVLDVASGQMRALTGNAQLEGYPVVSPDGRSVAYWRNRDGRPWNFQDVWVTSIGGGPGLDVSAALDRNIYLTHWAADGKWLLVGANEGTHVALWRLTPAGSASPVPLGDVVPVNGYWIDADIDSHGDIYFVGQNAIDPFEIYRVPAEGGTPVALTHVNAGLTDLTLARQETVTWKGPAGRTLSGVLTYPANYAVGRRYPLVLTIHGGPNSNSRKRFSLLPQLLAGHDWVVFEPNYRGGDDQGNAFYASIYRDAGQGPGEDVMSGVDELKRRGLIDPQRMAVTGWSYGGFMTTWLAGHYPVWKAAVAGAPVTDWVEMYDLSDGNVTQSASTGSSPYIGDGMAINRRQSPSSSVTHITSPMLIMCDTGDFRVPIAQSFGLYRALVDNHVKTEFYAIPVGGHFPGDPIRQMDVYERWQNWLVPYLR